MSGKEKSKIFKWNVLSEDLFLFPWESPFFVSTASNEKTVFGRIRTYIYILAGDYRSLNISPDVDLGNPLMDDELTISVLGHALARRSNMSHDPVRLQFEGIKLSLSFLRNKTVVRVQLEFKEINKEKFKNSICESLQSVKESKVDSIYEKLLFDESIHDIQLIVGEKQYPVHKAVLAANSPVFHRMFTHQMKETLSKKVVIKGMDPEVLEELLKYMYTKRVDKLQKLASDLLIAADRYEMDEFKFMCERELIKSLNVENALQSVILAERHNAVELKKYGFYIIMSNFTEVCKKGEFKDFIKSYPNFLLELNQEMAVKCKIEINE